MFYGHKGVLDVGMACECASLLELWEQPLVAQKFFLGVSEVVRPLICVTHLYISAQVFSFSPLCICK
jgi:hypothetical protein